MNIMWDIALENQGGEVTRVERYNEVGIQLPTTEIELVPQVNRHINTWKLITERLLVEQDKKLRNVTLRDGNIQRLKQLLPLPSITEERKVSPLEIKMSSMELEADLVSLKDNYYNPNPNLGRPQVRLTAFEMYEDSRRILMQRHKEAVERGYLHNEEITKSVINSTFTHIGVANRPTLRQALEMIDNTLLFVLSATGRTTYFDRERNEYQPVNLAGFMISQTVDGTLNVFRLSPWKGYDSWEKLPDDIQFAAADAFAGLEPAMDQKLRRIADIMG